MFLECKYNVGTRIVSHKSWIFRDGLL